jgi:hypothetical protein
MYSSRKKLLNPVAFDLSYLRRKEDALQATPPNKTLLQFRNSCAIGFSILAFAFTTRTFAADFQATGTIKQPGAFQDRIESSRKEASWSLPGAWSGPNANGPTTAADVGYIGDGHSVATGDPLGKPGDQPTIQVDKGGVLYIAHETNQPIRLNGGTIHGTWDMGRIVSGPIDVIDDSTLYAYADTSHGGELHLTARFSNTKPVTLTVHGDVRWEGDSSKTCSANFRVKFGSFFLAGAGDSSYLGTGDILLLPSTRFVFLRAGDQSVYRLVNNVFGDGTIQVDGDDHHTTLTTVGVTLHPGQPQQAGTLVTTGTLQFDRAPNGTFNKLIIEVHGPGDTVDREYSQLVSRGPITDTLDNVDLTLLIDPALPADEVKKYVLNILDAKQTDITGFKPFHSVTVRHGDQTGTAKITFHADESNIGGIATVSEISVP